MHRTVATESDVRAPLLPTRVSVRRFVALPTLLEEGGSALYFS